MALEFRVVVWKARHEVIAKQFSIAHQQLKLRSQALKAGSFAAIFPLFALFGQTEEVAHQQRMKVRSCDHRCVASCYWELWKSLKCLFAPPYIGGFCSSAPV